MYQQVPSIYAEVFVAVDAAIAMRSVPAHSETTIQRAIAFFRSRNSDREALQCLQDLSVAMHRIGPLGDRSSSAKRQLEMLATLWISRLPIH
jgi:hypothetical protein